MGLFGNLLGGLLGGAGNTSAANDYAKKAAFNPYNINTSSGNVSFDKANHSVSGTLSPQQQQLQQYLYSQGQGLVGQGNGMLQNGGVSPGMMNAYSQYAGSIPGMPNYNSTSGGLLSGLGNIANMTSGQAFGQNPYGAQQGQFGNAASGFLGQLGSFNPQQLASNYTSNLRSQAIPGQQRAVNSTVQGLFNTGRLGSTGGADVLGQLANSQNQQDLGFQQAGMDYAGNEQSRIAGLAGNMGQQSGMFGQLGDQFQQNNLNTAMNAAGMYGNIDQQGFNNAFQLNGLQDTRNNQRFANAMQLFGLGNQSQGVGLAASQLGSGFIGQGQGIDQQLLSMIGMGGQLGSQQSSANSQAYQPLMQAKQDQSSMFGDIFSQLFPF